MLPCDAANPRTPGVEVSITLSRRRFLALSAGAAGALAFRGSPLAAAEARRPKQVIVVGAGLAGLAAALALVERGHEVVVLEAQTRPGGRVLTARAPFADGLYADMGAARIPRVHDSTLRYIERFRIPLTTFWPPSYDDVHLMRGKRLVAASGERRKLADYPVSLTDRERELGFDGLTDAVYGPLAKLAGDPRSPNWPPPALRRYDAFTPLGLAREGGWSPDVAAVMQFGWGELDCDYGVLEDIHELAHDPHFAERLKMVGGNDQLPRAMATELAGRIWYGRKVVAIEQSERGVRVHSAAPLGVEAHEADRVVVAAPFVPVRRVEFSPPLSPEKARAIRELRYDPLARVAVQVRSRPWAEKGRIVFAKTDLPSEIWDATWNLPGGRAIVSVFVKERAALRLMEMTEAERVSFAVAHAEKALPNLSAVVEGGVSKDWTSDPWAGGLSWLGPGQFTALMPHVATAEGRIHFAGEHTSAWHGWMQGALESGNRAAREVDAAS
jgi:monoamine oxidase